MTELLYLHDSYLREFDATVTSVNGQTVTLDQTAFFPSGGGQPSDAGLLRWPGGEARVLDIKKDGASARHDLDGPVPS